MKEEFKIVKKNVKDKYLKDIVKNLGLAIFGYDNDDNKAKTFAPSEKKQKDSNNTNKSFLNKYMNKQLQATYIDCNNEQIINNDIHDYVDLENGIISRKEFFEKFYHFLNQYNLFENEIGEPNARQRDMINYKNDLVNAVENKFPGTIKKNPKSSGSGVKMLTAQQMISRLPILLAQIQAGNNSNKLKNELIQLIYSLYRSKKITKTVYNNLIKVI